MTIQATYTERDYLRAQYLHLRSRVWLYVFFGLAAVLLLASFFVSPSWDRSWISLGGLFGLLLYLLILLFVVMPLRVRRLFRQQKLLHETYQMEITPAGFTNTSRRGSATYGWSDFHKFRASKNVTLVYQSDVMFHMFPRHCFTDEQYAELQSYLQSAFSKTKGPVLPSQP